MVNLTPACGLYSKVGHTSSDLIRFLILRALDEAKGSIRLAVKIGRGGSRKGSKKMPVFRRVAGDLLCLLPRQARRSD